MTLTDFLVSAALYKPSPAIKECKAILKKLNEVQAQLLSEKSEHPDYADVLSAQKDLYRMLFLLARKDKTKPTQHSVKELQGMGVSPNIIVLRCDANSSARAMMNMTFTTTKK